MLVDLQECSIPADELPPDASEYATVFTPTRAQLAADTRALLDELGGSARATLVRLETNLADHKSSMHQAKAESEKALMLSRTQRSATGSNPLPKGALALPCLEPSFLSASAC